MKPQLTDIIKKTNPLFLNISSRFPGIAPNPENEPPKIHQTNYQHSRPAHNRNY
jgi:hypothetical protein